MAIIVVTTAFDLASSLIISWKSVALSMVTILEFEKLILMKVMQSTYLL